METKEVSVSVCKIFKTMTDPRFVSQNITWVWTMITFLCGWTVYAPILYKFSTYA